MKPNYPKAPKPYRPPMHKMRNIRAIRATTEHAIIDPEVVYEDLLSDLAHGSNGFAWACCPFHDDNNPSLCVNVESGWYKCMSSNCGETGSDIVGFVSHLLGLEYADARRYLEQHYG